MLSALYKPSQRILKHIRMSILEEMTNLANQNKSCNLAQGFPDWETPKFVRDYLTEATNMHENQYFRVAGHPDLAKAISKEYSQKMNREINHLTEITLGNGATGILSNIFAAFLEKDDEVILFEPLFEFYMCEAEIFGGKVVPFEMNTPEKGSNEWKIDFDKLEKLFTNKTKMILLNSPHNPTGKILKEEEILKIIKILKKWPNVIVISDEVYEYMTFGKEKHLRFASYDDMWNRTISVYSAGKTFSCTGWRVGYGIGPEHLIKPMIAVQNWLAFCLNRPAQVAIAKSMEQALSPYQGKSSYYEYLQSWYEGRKEKTYDIIRKSPINYRTLEPEGGFFVLTDITDVIPQIPKKYFYKEGSQNDERPIISLNNLEKPDYSPDNAFVRWMTKNYGVTGLPMFSFYTQTSNNPAFYRGSHLVRYTLCKKDETLDLAKERLVKKY